MAMINQIRRRSGQPTPYFVRGPPGQYDRAVALLLLDYTYPCGPHCRGLVVIPAWQGRSAAAVAPMIELDLEWQKAQDIGEFDPEPHVQLYPYERDEWMRLYNDVLTFNPEEPRNVVPRRRLQELYALAIGRQRYWGSQRLIAPAP
ncbi:hypothetical protein IMSHALPRED_006663 [Imshaugia aleurites]|uniref:Uncharacterized protein n=1 Tax=Imshaugia aleurites TaxID=172621 RepID=A0A8H3ENC4_9LECA|nr:hypothetical protein IMSHALPRED_006663 [Imshaugia aleurites]